MKKGRIYTVVYTVVLCGACASALTYANITWQKMIKANEDFGHIKAIVEALRLVPLDAARDQIIAAYADGVTITQQDTLSVYEARSDGKLIGYGLDISGRGKYGVIKGVLAIAPDSQKILSLNVYDQNETPGLGGRVGTREWLCQFDDLPMQVDGVPGIIISSKVKGPNVVDSITGASKTTYQLGKTINLAIARFLSGGMALEELDLQIGVDAVTRATPGYPKHLVPPPHLRAEVKRPAFMAPADTINLALGKPVTSSMEFEPMTGEFSLITDGIKTCGEFDFVELDPGLHWVQVDLGAVETIYAIVVWHYYRNPVIYNDVIIQTSTDPAFEQDVLTHFNNDHDNSAGFGAGKDTAYYARWWGELVDTRGDDTKGTPARYVRVYTDGGASADDMTRFVEMAIYGKGVKAKPGDSPK